MAQQIHKDSPFNPASGEESLLRGLRRGQPLAVGGWAGWLLDRRARDAGVPRFHLLRDAAQTAGGCVELVEVGVDREGLAREGNAAKLDADKLEVRAEDRERSADLVVRPLEARPLVF